MKEQLKRELCELTKDLVQNGVYIRKYKGPRDQINLLAARVEILKSIAHRQGKLIQILDMDDESMKEAA